MNKWIIGIIIFLIILMKFTVYSVGVDQYVIVTEFGNPVKTISDPGVHFKFPEPFQNVIIIDKRLIVHNMAAAEYLTQEKKNIVINSFFCMKIINPIKFLESCNNDIERARSGIGYIVASELGAAIGSSPLTYFLHVESDESENKDMDKLLSDVTRSVNQQATTQYGIEVIDVRIKRLNFPEENKYNVYRRMREERNRIAKKFRSEGEAEATKIKAEADRESSQILSQASMEAEKIRGEGEAESIKIYAEAFTQGSEFYEFLKKMELYETVMDGDTVLVFSSQNELFSLFSGWRDNVLTGETTNGR